MHKIAPVEPPGPKSTFGSSENPYRSLQMHIFWSVFCQVSQPKAAHALALGCRGHRGPDVAWGQGSCGGAPPRTHIQRPRCARPAVAVCLTPMIQNPILAVMPLRGREDLVTVARRLDFKIIEDDAYGFLAGDDEPPPLAALAPEWTWYARLTSKALTLGLRTAWLMVPPGEERRAADLVRATVWTPPPLGAQGNRSGEFCHCFEADVRREIMSREV